MSPVIEESVVLSRVSRGKGVSVTGTLRGLPAAVAESPCPKAHLGLRMPQGTAALAFDFCTDRHGDRTHDHASAKSNTSN